MRGEPGIEETRAGAANGTASQPTRSLPAKQRRGNLQYPINSIDNHFNTQITAAAQHHCWDLAILGIHAAILTITDGIAPGKPVEQYRWFLEKFVDEDREGSDFSVVADTIHTWRTTLAHHWLHGKNYGMVFDFTMENGWEQRAEIIAFNPKHYYEAYDRAFHPFMPLWSYVDDLSPQEQEKVKQRYSKKFMK